MMTEPARKTSLKNKHLRNCDYSEIIPSCLHFTMLKKIGPQCVHVWLTSAVVICNRS